MSKLATITLYKTLVLASIDAQTFKRVDGVLSAESDQMKNALSSDSDENLDKYILHEHMEKRDANLRRRLTFCLVSESGVLAASNILKVDEPTFDYDLMVPDTFDQQRLQSLARKMHDYMVQGSLYDWYATQNMKGNVSATELEDMESEIVSMLRPSCVKRPLQPFGPRN